MSDILSTQPAELSNVPAWFNQLRQQGWESFSSIATPQRSDIAWRFANLKMLDFSSYKPAASAAAAANLPDEGVLQQVSKRLVFVNEELVHSSGELPQGVVVLPLLEALQSHGDLVKQHFMQRQTQLGSAKYSALHQANVNAGLFVHVPDNVQIEHPIEVSHFAKGAGLSLFPHTLVVAGKNARVCVVERFASLDQESALIIGVNDLVAAEGASLKYACLQQLNDKSRQIGINSTTVAKQADVKNLLINTGAAWVRQEILSRLEGEESNSDMLSISIASGEQVYDQRTFQHHASPHAKSDLLFKNTLYDKSTSVFSGLIFVDQGAHFTDAYQTCRNMLMSEEAEANSMPGLEINADQVKCSHGSTSAPISDEEIFYLRARGIHPARARQLIARGFSIEVIERFDEQDIEAAALAAIDAKLHSIQSF